MSYMETQRTRLVTVRFTTAEYAELVKDAGDMSLSEYVRKSLAKRSKLRLKVQNLREARKRLSEAYRLLGQVEEDLLSKAWSETTRKAGQEGKW